MTHLNMIERISSAVKLNIALTSMQIGRCLVSKPSRYTPTANKLKKLERDKYEQMHEDFSAEMKRKRQMKLKIIQRKEFKLPPLANILTWRAKEQIKYLTHLTKTEPGNSEAASRNEPHQWDEIRGQIIEVFPISPMNLGRVVKQLRMVMKDEQDIENHDRRAARRWHEMLDLPFERLPSDALKRTVIDLVSSGQIRNLANASGVEGMEEYGTPNKSEQVEATRMPETGPFYSMYKIHGSYQLNQPETPLDLHRLLQLTKTEEDPEDDSEPDKSGGSADNVTGVDSSSYNVLKGIQLKYTGVNHEDLEKLMLSDGVIPR